MNKNLRAALIVGGVLAALAAYFFYIMGERAEMTAAANGVVLSSKFVEDTESSSLDETRIVYRFEANGQAFEGTDTVSGADRTGEHPAGRGIAVCYNPKEPTSSRVNRSGACG